MNILELERGILTGEIRYKLEKLLTHIEEEVYNRSIARTRRKYPVMIS
ncbi:MAG: hypothetical protein ACLFST_01400 [Spirochaetia bacterium]